MKIKFISEVAMGQFVKSGSSRELKDVNQLMVDTYHMLPFHVEQDPDRAGWGNEEFFITNREMQYFVTVEE